MTNDNDTPEFDSSLHPVHEAAEIYPEMSTERRKDLAADIKANGLRHPIVLCMSERHGRLAVLKGRARYDACRETGVEPEFTEYQGDPEAYLVSVNLRSDRSNLQRCLIAARTVTAKPGGDRLSAYEQRFSIRAICADGEKPKARTIEEAAEIYRLNPSGVRRARHILDVGLQEFIARIFGADYLWLSIKGAHDIVTPTELEKLDGLTSDAKQRKWLNGERIKTRVNPLLGPAERFQCSWRYLSFEDQQRFVREEALPFLIAQARLDGLTEIALPDATIILVSPPKAA
jgi:hypothetical protein